MKPPRLLFRLLLLALAAAPLARSEQPKTFESKGNPIFQDVFTADPAPLVVGDTLYVYVGHDNAKGDEMFTMPAWRCYSTKNGRTWTSHGDILAPDDFKWGEKNSAWASQVVQKGNKFYFYGTVRGDQTTPGSSICVAVADKPTGPFKDARGSALIRDDMTPNSKKPWEDIDPTVFIDDDGTPWLAWGNGDCYLAKLKPNMTELDGEIIKLTAQMTNYTEGPWLYKRGKLYYMIYAANIPDVVPEQIAYATAEKITGPWTYRGLITGPAEKSFTIHPGVVEFKGHWLFFYHNASLTLNGEEGAIGRRAVCVEFLQYNPDGTIKPITQTKEGVSVPPKK